MRLSLPLPALQSAAPNTGRVVLTRRSPGAVFKGRILPLNLSQLWEISNPPRKLILSRAGGLFPQEYAFLAELFNYGTRALARRQADIDVIDRGIAHSRRDVRR